MIIAEGGKIVINKIRQLLIFSYFDDHLNPRYSADRASDGNTTTTALTKRERNPWYVAELDQEYKALTILIEGNSYNSGDIFTGAKYVFIDHYISKTASSWKLGRPLLCSKQLI